MDWAVIDLKGELITAVLLDEHVVKLPSKYLHLQWEKTNAETYILMGHLYRLLQIPE